MFITQNLKNIDFLAMINDINIDKILERQENGNVYILHVQANSQILSLEIQDKMKGDIWSGQFNLEQIEEISLKAKNPKKYAVFIKMLMSSLLGQTQSVLIQILTYAQLQRKMNLASRGRNVQNNKKYVIMTYMSQFDKAHYPLALNFQDNPSVQRLKITIRRLAQQMTLNCQQRSSPQSFQAKQISMLKYENQTLKTRIKSLQQRLQHSSLQGQNIMDRSNILVQQKQVKKQLQSTKFTLSQKVSQIQQLKIQIKQLSDDKLRKQNLITDLKQQVADNKEDRIEKKQQQQTFALLEEKFNQMNKETRELVAELQHSREKEKKNALKVLNLQKQLQKMMTLQQKNRIGNTGIGKMNNNLSLSRKSMSEKSQKSYTSQKSQKSNQSKTKGGLQAYLNKPNTQNLNNKKPTTKRSSVYDSDTQSSKLRRANNSKVSPFRQTTTKPSGNISSSSKRASNNFTGTMNRFDRNILSNNRDRSRSKSVKKQHSPPADIPTDNFASSSQDQRNITEAITKLKGRKNMVKLNDPRQKNQRQKDKNTMGPLQKKITNIAEMLRKAKSREGRD